MIFAIRHGEREDAIAGKTVFGGNGIDPKITPKGIEQAKRTGHYISKILAEKGVEADKVYIYSSPFMRCLMTAQHIREGL